ncbi:MAG: hypothetical protein KatS3mg102_1833 [Planctomycetota bacterium]|nr:MAG: hypothetical protein KatS3mg102_1833 [Planctomycetota bacterium]
MAPGEDLEGQAWREATLLAVLGWVLLLGVPIALLALVLVGWFAPALLRSPLFWGMFVAYGALLWVRHARMPYRQRAWAFVIACALMGLQAVAIFGCVTAPVLACALAVMAAALFIGPRALLAVLAATSAGVALAGLPAALGLLHPVALPGVRPSFWQALRAAAEFAIVGGGAAVLVQHMVRRLEQQERAIQTARNLEALGKLAGGIAHDVNNALQVVRIWAELLRRPQPAAQLARGLEEIERAVERTTALTRRLLALGRGPLRERRRLDISAHLAAWVESMRRTLPEDMTLVAYIEPTPPVRCDPVALEQVLLNLVVNARDALGSRGTIELRVDSVPRQALPPSHLGEVAGKGPLVRIEVADDGPGMSDEVRQRIFEPFFTTKGEQGTGLGLSIVYAAVRAHGGAIAVDSAPGRGTRFTIWLPAAEEVAAAARADQPAPPRQAAATTGAGGEGGAGGVLRVLLAEDAPALREGMREVLELAGVEVVTAADGDEALQRIESGERFDVLCTDGIMPGAPVREVIARFVARNPGGGVLVCSGHLEQELARRELDPTRYALLPKPFSAEALLGCLGALTARELRLPP